MRLFFYLVMLLALPSFISAQSLGDWKFSGQIQLRSEVDGRDFLNRTHPLTFASLRTRVGVEKSIEDKVTFFVQLQDSRVFGEEQGTLNAIDNIDLHQGYVQLNNLFDWNMDVQAGRFEVAYGTERFLGAVGWHYVGRSWDGVRFKFNPGFKLDVFGLTHSEYVPYIGSPMPFFNPPLPEKTPSHSLYGFWSTFSINPDNRLDIFGYYNINRYKLMGEDPLIDIYTLGVNHFGTYSSLSTVFEGAYQFGEARTRNTSAFLISGQANYSLKPHKFGAGLDYLSGTDQMEPDNNSFDVSFGTNHKFYGYMDYFPTNLNGLGLIDIYLSYNFLPEESKWEGNVNIHHFIAAQPLLLYYPNPVTGGTIPVPENKTLGQELDLTVKYNFIKGTTLTWGGSLFFAADQMERYFGTLSPDPAFWSYLMITANF